MERQLILLEVQTDWRLDDRTREVGRAGIREARAALRDALRQATVDEPTTGDRHAA